MLQEVPCFNTSLCVKKNQQYKMSCTRQQKVTLNEDVDTYKLMKYAKSPLKFDT